MKGITKRNTLQSESGMISYGFLEEFHIFILDNNFIERAQPNHISSFHALQLTHQSLVIKVRCQKLHLFL